MIINIIAKWPDLEPSTIGRVAVDGIDEGDAAARIESQWQSFVGGERADEGDDAFIAFLCDHDDHFTDAGEPGFDVVVHGG